MTMQIRLLLVLVGIVVFGLLGFVIYQQHEMSTMTQQINASMVAQKELLDGVMRSQASYATKDDINNFAKENGVNLDQIRKDLAGLNATITGVNNVVVSSGGTQQTNVASTSTTPDKTTTVPTVNCNGTQIPCPNADPHGYQSNVQHLALTEPFAGSKPINVPLGDVAFDASQSAPWSVNLSPRTYDMTNVLGTDANGRNYVYNKFSITTNGKTYPVEISNAKFEQEYPSPSFSFWNPRLLITAGGGLSLSPINASVNAGGTIQIMSYGKTKVSPAISILQLGVGYQTATQSPTLIINPVSFNIGSLLPNGLINNTYVGPSLQVDFLGRTFISANISSGL